MIHLKEAPAVSPPRRARLRDGKVAIDWAASGWAGVAGGIVLLAIQTLLPPLITGESPVSAARRIAAIAMGGSALTPPTGMTPFVFLAAAAVHLPLSLIYARLLAAIVRDWSAARSAAMGALFGACLYALNYYAFAALFPWFMQARGWIGLGSHIAFGVTAGWLYQRLASRTRRTGGADSRLSSS